MSGPFSTRSALEDAFFLEEDRRLLERLRELDARKEKKQALAEVSGIRDEEVLERLVALGATPEMVAAMAVVPLVEVAWADGEVDEKERRAILDSLERAGVPRGGLEEELVRRWLERHPGPALLAAWQQYVRGLCRQMSEQERRALREEVLRATRVVAEASGGVLGLGRVSAAEREMMEQLEEAFQ